MTRGRLPTVAEVPALLERWRPDNTLDPAQLTVGTTRKVKWRCPNGPDHHYETPVQTLYGALMAGRTGCPYCRGLRPSVTNRLDVLFPWLAEQWHPALNGDLKPDQVVAGSNTDRWWQCPVAADHVWPASPQHRSKAEAGRGCPYCANLRPSVTNRLDVLHPELATQWHPTRNGGRRPADVVSSTHDEVWWLCPEGPDHEWSAPVTWRTRNGLGCGFCANRRLSVTNSVAARAGQWLYLFDSERNAEPAERTLANTEVEVHWRCPVAADHCWSEATGRVMANSWVKGNSGCPACSARMGYAERGAILHRLADLMLERSRDLGMADTLDMGKPISLTKGHDVARSASNFRFFADHARLSTGDALPMDSGHHAYSVFGPAGVVAAISPWNFPLMLETWKVAPALAWGNTVVLKPAEDTPSSAHLLALLALEAGMPPGVLNVVQGFGAERARPGADRVRPRRPDHLHGGVRNRPDHRCGGRQEPRAGQPRAGRQGREHRLRRRGPGHRGGVVGQGDLHQQRAGLSGREPDLRPRQRLRGVRRAPGGHGPGDGLWGPDAPGHATGSARQQGALRQGRVLLRRAARRGRDVALGRSRRGVGSPAQCRHRRAAARRMCREEIFGPLAVVVPFTTEEEVVALANDTRYGLNAIVFTENLSRAHRVPERLRAGTVWVNCFFIRDLRAPFGGVGDSGVGREGGDFSREFFTEPKAVVMAIDRSR